MRIHRLHFLIAGLLALFALANPWIFGPFRSADPAEVPTATSSVLAALQAVAFAIVWA